MGRTIYNVAWQEAWVNTEEADEDNCEILEEGKYTSGPDEGSLNGYVLIGYYSNQHGKTVPVVRWDDVTTSCRPEHMTPHITK